jgi:dedicator of cytokinesis protein 3
MSRFVRTCGHRGIFVKYAHKLTKFHTINHRYVEAGLILKLHADVLDWSRNKVVEPLPEFGFMGSESSFDRKFKILSQVIVLLEKGKAWERAAELVKDIIPLFDSGWDLNYARLSSLYAMQSRYLSSIWTESEPRFPPSYYRVQFHGSGWPDTLVDSQYIYKAGEWERIASFIDRILLVYPDAEFIRKPGPVDGDRMGLQISAVRPEMDVRNWLRDDGFYGWPLKWEGKGKRGCEIDVPLYLVEPDLDPNVDGLGRSIIGMSFH